MEEIEVPTEQLQEEIHHHAEHARGKERLGQAEPAQARPAAGAASAGGGAGAGGCCNPPAQRRSARVVRREPGWGVCLRSAPHPRPLPAARCARGGRGAARTGDRGELARAHGATPGAAQEAAPTNGAHSPQCARTLAILIQAMRALKAMRGGAPETTTTVDDDDDDMPADIDEFRRDLARRIDAFVASRTDAANANGNSGAAPLDEAG